MVSISFGLAGCLIGLSYNRLSQENNVILLNCGIVPLLIITLAWGRWYGLISVASCFIINPFALNSYRGWIVLLPIASLLVWFMCIGKSNNKGPFDGKNYINNAITHLKYTLIFVLFYLAVFPYMIQHYPMTWNNEVLSAESFKTYIYFLVRNVAHQMALLAVCEVFLLLPFFRRIFRLELFKYSNYTFRIVLGSTFYGMFMSLLMFYDNYISDKRDLNMAILARLSVVKIKSLMEVGSICLIFGGLLAWFYQRQMLMNEKLLISEAKYQNIFYNLNDIYFETTIEGDILTISPSVESILG
jgi:PAS domain-containing protein